MMFLDGNIAAPPTITVFSPDSSLFIIFFSSAVAGATTIVVMASAEKATADNSANRLDMKHLPIGMRAGRHPPAITMARVAWTAIASSSGRATGGVCVGFGKNFFVLAETNWPELRVPGAMQRVALREALLRRTGTQLSFSRLGP